MTCSKVHSVLADLSLDSDPLIGLDMKDSVLVLIGSKYGFESTKNIAFSGELSIVHAMY